MDNNLSFDTGMQKFYINGSKERYIEFNPLDANLYKRFSVLQDFFSEVEGGMRGKDDEKNIMEYIAEKDAELKSKLDEVFGKGTSERAFGDLNLFTPTLSGTLIFENFLEALSPHIQKSAIIAHQQSSKRIKKYTEKYEKANENTNL